MNNDDERRRHFERIAAMEMERRSEEQRVLSQLAFKWQDLSQIEHGELDSNPLDVPPPFAVELRDKRRIVLRELHQYPVYNGVLAGVPPTPEPQLIQSLRVAKRIFPEFDRTPAMLTPQLNGGVFKRGPGQKPFPYPLVWLPSICSIGLFDSDPPAHDEASDFSTLVIIWFQDAVGIPTGASLGQLRELDWESHALPGAW